MAGFLVYFVLIKSHLPESQEKVIADRENTHVTCNVALTERDLAVKMIYLCVFPVPLP